MNHLPNFLFQYIYCLIPRYTMWFYILIILFLQILDLLKCSLLSKSTLTDLFLVQKPLLNNSIFSLSTFEKSRTMTTIQIKVQVIMRKSGGKDILL